jgi:predicted ABC-type ATPase
MEHPNVVILAGPNGAGKSTISEPLLSGTLGIRHYVNADSLVSGLYFAHPEARYFAVDLITRDQVEDYAKRKEMPVAEVERWLQANLAYDSQ